MKHKTIWFLSCLFVLSMPSLVRADDPTSRFFPLSRLASSLPSSSTGVAVQFEVWDQAADGTLVFAEAHTVDTDAGSSISNDTGRPDLLLGRGTAGGLAPANFPAGSTRYLDVTQGGTTVLTARVPLYAAVFGISPPSEVPGNLTLADSSGTAGNILKGGAVFIHNFGTNNAFLGSNAGNLSMTGGNNTASGATALQNNTSGNYNTALGTGALFSNTNGEGNTASGYHALYTNCSPTTPCSASQGFYNTAIGTSALAFNTTGYYNTASGGLALLSNTSGYGNTASGYQALFSNTTGAENTASGDSALYSNTTGGANTASGYQALVSNTTGGVNTASGYQTLHNNTNGSFNTASGYQALYSNCGTPCSGVQGSFNTASGVRALLYNTTGWANTASGYQALYSNTTGENNTASGTNVLHNNTNGSFNTASGLQALFANISGDGNTAIGFDTLSGNSTGNYNTAIGYSADVCIPGCSNLTNATAIGYNAVVNASNKIRLGNTAVSVIEGQVPYTFTSDKHQKENFQPVNAEGVLAKLAHLPVSTWNYIGHDPKQFRHYGPVAQDFFAAFGHDGVGTIGTDTTINSGDMEGILVIAVQALEKRTAELATLKAENAALKARLEKLERSMATLVVKAE